MRTTLASCSLALIMLAMLAPAAFATDEIQACVSRRGIPRIVDDSSECRRSQEALSWPSTSGVPFRVLDSAGQVIGIPYTNPSGRFAIFIEAIGLSIDRSALSLPPSAFALVYESVNCTGDGYLLLPPGFDPGSFFARLIPGLTTDPTEFFATGTRVDDIRALSFADNLFGGCGTVDVEAEAIPLEPFSGELPFTLPVTQPIYVGPVPPAEAP